MRAGDVDIVVARYAGYCYGVERALRITEEALEDSPSPVATLGPIIHNPSVVGRLEERGVEVVDDVDEARRGTLIVRTHGVAPDVAGAAHERHAPRGRRDLSVRRRRAAQGGRAAGGRLRRRDPRRARPPGGGRPRGFRRRGRRGGRGRRRSAARQAARQARGRRRADDADARQSGDAWPRPWRRWRASCSSTTRSATPPRSDRARPASWPPRSTWSSSSAAATAPTRRGWRSSAAPSRASTYHIESAAELRREWLAGARRIGVTAGASTPDEEIEATVAALLELCGG